MNSGTVSGELLERVKCPDALFAVPFRRPLPASLFGFHRFIQCFDETSTMREGRTWAITVRRGSCKSLLLLNLGRFR